MKQRGGTLAGGVVCGGMRDEGWDRTPGKSSFGGSGTGKQILLLPLGAQSPLA